MTGRIRRTAWLLVAPLAVAVLDLGLTLRGQPARYWGGEYEFVNEANPPFRAMLQYHPLAFVAGFSAYAAGFCLMVFLLPPRPAKALSLAGVIGHAWGASSWLLAFHHGYWLCLALTLSSAVAVVLTWEQAEREGGDGYGG